MKCIENDRGSAMIITLILVMVVMTVGTAFLFSVNSEIVMNRRMEQRTVATYMAQAGIEHGLMLIQQSVGKGTDPVCPAGVFKVVDKTNEIHEYQITELSKSAIKSEGDLILNGKTVSKVTINASINNGVVSVAVQ